MHSLKKSKNLLQVIIVNNYIRALKRNFGNQDIPMPYLRRGMFNLIIYGKFHKIWAMEYGINPIKVNIDWEI